MKRADPEQERVVGLLLGDARQAAGLSQPEAARRLGISQSRLAQLELGNRRLRLTEAFELADLYGVTISAFDPRGHRLPDGPRKRRERVDRHHSDAPRTRRRHSGRKSEGAE